MELVDYDDKTSSWGSSGI